MTKASLIDLMIEACDDKRADNIMKFDVRNSSSVTDYYLICHGTSDRQIQAISDNVVDMARESGIDPIVEGYKDAKWILVDVDRVVVHIFLKSEREYYNLERLFMNGEYVER